MWLLLILPFLCVNVVEGHTRELQCVGADEVCRVNDRRYGKIYVALQATLLLEERAIVSPHFDEPLTPAIRVENAFINATGGNVTGGPSEISAEVCCEALVVDDGSAALIEGGIFQGGPAGGFNGGSAVRVRNSNLLIQNGSFQGGIPKSGGEEGDCLYLEGGNTTVHGGSFSSSRYTIYAQNYVGSQTVGSRVDVYGGVFNGAWRLHTALARIIVHGNNLSLENNRLTGTLCDGNILSVTVNYGLDDQGADGLILDEGICPTPSLAPSPLPTASIAPSTQSIDGPLATPNEAPSTQPVDVPPTDSPAAPPPSSVATTRACAFLGSLPMIISSIVSLLMS